MELCEALVETIKDKKEREMAREREIERHEDEIREFAQAKRVGFIQFRDFDWIIVF